MVWMRTPPCASLEKLPSCTRGMASGTRKWRPEISPTPREWHGVPVATRERRKKWADPRRARVGTALGH